MVKRFMQAGHESPKQQKTEDQQQKKSPPVVYDEELLDYGVLRGFLILIGYSPSSVNELTKNEWPLVEFVNKVVMSETPKELGELVKTCFALRQAIMDNGLVDLEPKQLDSCIELVRFEHKTVHKKNNLVAMAMLCLAGPDSDGAVLAHIARTRARFACSYGVTVHMDLAKDYGYNY